MTDNRSGGMKALAMALLLVGFAAGAATPLYKSTMPDGKVVYSEKPVPGAKRVDTVEPPPAKTGTTTVTPQEKARATQPASGPAAQQSSPLADARNQLKNAQAAQEAGKEPLPGERMGTAGGASRLTDAYHARQKSLELSVEAARKRVAEVERVR
jgi:hypothetical protein